MAFPARPFALAFAALVAPCVTGCLAPDAVPGGGVGAGGSGGGWGGGGAPGDEVAWARGFGADNDDNQRARSIAAFPSGDVLVAGDFSGSLTFDPLAPLQNTEGRDAFVVRLNANGLPVWAAAFAGNGDQLAYRAVTTAEGGMVVAGSFTGALLFAGEELGGAPEGEEGFVAMLDETHSLKWLMRLHGTGSQAVHALALGPDGDVFVAGYFDQELRLGEIVVDGDPLGRDFFVAKINRAGAAQWARSYGGEPAQLFPGQPSCFLAVSDDGAIHLAGTFGGTLQLGENLGALGTRDVFVGQLDADGEPQWGHALGAPGKEQRAAGLVVDAKGHVILAGDLRGDAALGNDMTLRSDGDESDAFLVSYDAKGALVWARRYGSTAVDRAGAIAVSAANDLLFTGQFRRAIHFGKEAILQNTSATSTQDDVFVAKLTLTGEPLQSAAFGGNESETPTSIATDAAGNVLFSGYFLGAVDFGDEQLDAENGDDIFITKLGE